MRSTAGPMAHVACTTVGALILLTTIGISVDAQAGTRTYLYVWTGPLNTRLSRDFMVTIDVTREAPTFGQILSVTDSDCWGSDPHHMGLSANGSVLGAGGIHAFVRQNPDLYFFDVGATPWAPRFIKSHKPLAGAVPDDVVKLSNGGFMVSLMGDKTGGGHGRIGEYDANLNLVAEHAGSIYPHLTWGFNPHGLAINEAINRMVTVDLYQFSSTLFSSHKKEIVKRHTVRVWDFQKREIIKVIDLTCKHSNGNMVVRFVGQVAMFTTGNNSVWAVDALTFRNEMIYEIPHMYRPTGHCVFSSPFRNNTRIAGSIFNPSVIMYFDITDVWNPILLDTVQLPAGAGPHATVNSPDGKFLAVSTYYLDQDPTLGKLQFLQDRKVRFFEITANETLVPWHQMAEIDFKEAFPQRGWANPHGMALKTAAAPPPNFVPWDPETDQPLHIPVIR